MVTSKACKKALTDGAIWPQHRLESLGVAEAAMDKLAVPCFIKNTDLVYTHVNEALCRFMGFARSDMIAQTVYNILPQDQADIFTQSDLQLLKDGEDQTFEMLVSTRRGEQRYVRMHKHRLLDEQDKVIGITGAFIDISDHKETEAKLRAGRKALRNALEATIHAMAKAQEKRDPYTAGHQMRVAELAGLIATRLGWDDERIDGVRLAASIHDLGKLQIPADILNRPGRLVGPEMELIRQHSESGYDILVDIPFPWPVAEMVRQHHERLDGSGYPRGLHAQEILPEAKVIAAADVFEAILSHRPYRPGRGVGAALEEIQQGAGSKYDPKVCRVLIDLVSNGMISWAQPD